MSKTRELCIVFAAITAIMFLISLVFADEIVTKVDDNTAKIVISNVRDENGTKTTLTQERNFTLEELQQAKTASENALKSWQDKKKEAEDNIVIQEGQAALWDRLITEALAQGIVLKKAVPVK